MYGLNTEKMKFTLVLGFPRSGTSIVSTLIERLGFDLCIEESNSLDNIYKSTHPFNQRRDIHVFLASIGIGSMKIYKERVSLDIFIYNKSRVVKEPYLLFILDQIREFVLNIVLVIRNPNEVIESSTKFFEDNGEVTKIQLEDWNNYYKIFMNSVGNIPYTVVNYNNMVKNPGQTINTLSAFLGSNLHIDYSDIQERIYKCTQRIPADTMYIYKCITGMLPIDNTVVINTSVNAKCFCKSGKKYKKCCALTFNKI